MIIYSNFGNMPQKSRKERIMNAILYIVFGLLFMFLSNFVVKSFALIIGISIIIMGVNRFIFAITYKQSFDLIMSVLIVLLGVFVTMSNEGTITFIKYLISFGAILIGIQRIFFSYMLRQYDKYWYVGLGIGILISVLGILMIGGTFNLNIIVVILGVILTINGITKLLQALKSKDDDNSGDNSRFFETLNSNRKPDDDVIDVEFKEKNDQDDR